MNIKIYTVNKNIIHTYIINPSNIHSKVSIIIVNTNGIP
ncbi:MAG: hypothetical protein Terrestrivirus3_82 [Terrestrivirus sp.]|uniref:Uncharacterized protein n=1 Tax=Terrestrivirus sp. TaxID=2487775 RepID=A0A3G4ZQB9_9VIRU|nr:MAG: hypothetical protein Terrestrivirus3_82 [Terrestrivirus sp.]